MAEMDPRFRLSRDRKGAVRQNRSLTVAALLLLLVSPVQALTVTYGDLEITPEAPPKGSSGHGYYEYVFHVHNKSEEQTHILSLSIPYEKRYSRDDAIRELRRTVQVGPKETVRLTLLQPDHPPIGGSDVEVTVDGRRQERELQLNVPQHASYFRHGYATMMVEPLILLGPRVQPFPTAEPSAPLIPGMAAGGPGMPGGMGAAPAMPPGMAPPLPNRRGKRMSPARPPGTVSITLPPGRPDELPPEASALPLVLPPLWDAPLGLGILAALPVAREVWDLDVWVTLFTKSGFPSHGFQFVNAENWSSDWLGYSRYDGIVVNAADLQSVPADVRTALWQYVETGGSLLVLGPCDLRGLSAITERKDDEAGWRSVRAGFGVCRVSPSAHYEDWHAHRFTLLAKDWQDTATALQRRINNTQDYEEFRVIEDLGIPIRGLFVLMFLFTLAIGPVNLFVLSYRKRRIWLLWTTPAISLCTCLAVFGYMLLSEGWQGRLHSDTLTLLDETTHRATTIGWTGVYSPLTPSDGLHFQYETEVAPRKYRRDRDSTAHSCTIDLSQDQHFIAGWVEARVPAVFKVRKSKLRRERVTLQRERDGRWSMLNGLGTPIHRFWYADDKGQIHTAEDIAAGARTLLTPTEQEALATAGNVRSLLAIPNWVNQMRQLAEKPLRVLRPGNYLAEVDDSAWDKPFLEDALRNAKNRNRHALILGFRQEEQ